MTVASSEQRFLVTTQCDGQVYLIAGTPELSAAERKELENKLKEREEFLIPIYHQVAVQFADLHDTPGRMQEKGVINVSTVVATSPDLSETRRQASVCLLHTGSQAGSRWGWVKTACADQTIFSCFGATFPFFYIHYHPITIYVIGYLLDSSGGKPHFTGGKLSHMWLRWGELLRWTSGCNYYSLSGFQQLLTHIGVEPSHLSHLLKPSSSLWLPGVHSPFPISAMGGVSISQARRWAPRGTGEIPAGAGGSWPALESLEGLLESGVLCLDWALSRDWGWGD